MKDNKKCLNDEQIENVTGGVGQMNAMNDPQPLEIPAEKESTLTPNQLTNPLSNQASAQKDDGNVGKVNTKNPG